jgi:hypothetical protein
MKKIELTHDKFAIVDDEDYDKLNQWDWYALVKNTSYAVAVRNTWSKTEKKGILFTMHRVIMNCPKDKMIDHKDGNGLNNQKSNLRICTNGQNQGNRKLNSNNKSGIKGVSWHKRDRKWQASIRVGKKRKHLGVFLDKLEAKRIYEKAAKQHFGEFYSDGIRI